MRSVFVAVLLAVSTGAFAQIVPPGGDPLDIDADSIVTNGGASINGQAISNGAVISVTDTNSAPRTWVAGFSNAPVSWDPDFLVPSVTMPDGTVGQMFEEIYVTVRNTSGVTITNGKAVRATSSSGFYSGATLASCTDTFDQVLGVIGLATMTITNGGTGKITLVGNVNEIDTTAFVEGSNLWLSTTAGELTMTKPTAAGCNQVLIGTCLRNNANVGRIGVAVRVVPLPENIGAVATNAFAGIVNGLSVSDPTLTISVDGTGPFATINPSPAGQIQYWFGEQIVSYGTSAVVRLTAGTTNTPTLNYVCALPDGTITNYTSYPYLTSGTAADARAIMFEVFLMDTNSIVAGTGYALRSWTDNVENRRGIGRISWIGERVRRLPAIWESGVMASLLATNSSVSDNYIMTADGVGWQMHSHTIPANTNRTSMWIINSSQGFREITNLNSITTLPDGTAMFNAVGDCHAINVFAFVESGITPKSTRIMLSLSSDSYEGGTPAATKLANCIADASSFDNTGVPVWMQGMTIRIARIVVRNDAGGRTYWIYDRRGQPLGTAGGGASGSGESDPVYSAALAAGALVTSSEATYYAAPACYQVTITNTSALSYTNTWSPTSAVSRITATSTGTVTFVMNWPANQMAYWGFCYDATGMPSTIFPAGAIYYTSGMYSNTIQPLGKSNYVSVMHSCASYQIMAFTNTLGTWGTP